MSIHYFRFAAGHSATPHHSRLLERLLARAAGVTLVADWRADAFRVIAAPGVPMPGVASAELYGQGTAADAAFVFVATAVHYIAEMSNVRLPAHGILSPPASEADELALDFNRVWNDAGIRLLAGRRFGLYCATDEPLHAATRDPEDMLDRHIENYLPSGAAAPKLRRLMSEIEMWLFEHPVNRARVAAGEPAITGLWLWGGGSPLTSLPEVRGWTAGDDPFFKALGGRGGVRGSTPGVVVTAAEPGTAEWSGVESQWLEASFEDLNSGRIDRIDLSAGDRCFSVNAGDAAKFWSRRFWRRPRPWWESFA